jgi:hypothetical protein
LCPFVKSVTVGRARDAHELGFDGPGERRAAVSFEDVVGACGVDIFLGGESIHKFQYKGLNCLQY